MGIQKSMFKRCFVKNGAGFTLVELLVVIAVSAAIAAIAIQGFPAYSEKSDFENIALDVALTVREAQVYGLGTREAGGTGFDVGYGVHTDSTASGNSSIIFFVDRDNDGVYDGSAADELLRMAPLKTGYRVSRLCLNDACTSAVNILDISFKRPSPAARFTADGAPGFLSVSKVSIHLAAPSGAVKKIDVYASGQIATP